LTPRYAFVGNGIVAGVFAATGQTCMAGSRLLVQRSVHDALVDRIVRRATSIRLGDPRADETEMGPLANEPQYRKVVSFFASAAARAPRWRAPSGPKTFTAATG
jgi:acyl-CoA reductase-like NAD-dependent aldehyde dehydrogenase